MAESKIGLCHDCYKSGIEITLSPVHGLGVCKNCKKKISKQATEMITQVSCTCKPCPIHEDEPHSTQEQREAETIVGETVEG